MIIIYNQNRNSNQIDNHNGNASDYWFIHTHSDGQSK